MHDVMQELLPCPFCGSPPLVGPTLDDMFVAMCANDRCCRFDNYWPTKAEAITAWNTRHQPQPSAEQATVDRIVAFAFKEASERLADECERDSEVITELATAIQRGDWK